VPSGRGIAAGQLRRLFEPFTQAHDGAEPPEHGTGLGLTIAHRLVALMGGELSVASTVGEGSRFWFEIELAAANGAGALERRPRSRLTGYEGPRQRVLAIDDVEANRLLFRDLLAPLGFQVALAVSATEALRSLEHLRPDLVLLDLRLPGMDGFALARRMRAEARFEGVKIPAASASVFGHDPGEALKAGCDAFISKPFLPEEFFARVGQLLELTWCEAEAEMATSDEPLPPALLEELRNAARLGDVVAIREVFTELRRLHPRSAALDEIEHAIDAFDVVRVRALAMQQLPGDAPGMSRGSSRPARILIVDDTPANLALLVDALHAAGYRPLVATSGVDALALLADARPDLILLDMRMPAMDGMATITRIQAHPQWREIPVIFMTAVEEPEQKVAAFTAGAVDYVTKPFQTDEVLARIGTHLRLKALQQELAAELAWRAEMEQQLEDSLEQAVLVIARDGRVQFWTQRARQLVTRYFPAVDARDRLPPTLEQLALVRRNPQTTVAGASGELTIRVVADGASDAPVIVLFEEQRSQGDYAPLRKLGLTERETEVLYWISQGKSNPEIGTIIGASAGTVKKHAQSIFLKLGVEGRSTAMLVALDVLRAR
jgi:CheY-like chemotaxis protein/DNA-binding CsgD family transcriptional regulator